MRQPGHVEPKGLSTDTVAAAPAPYVGPDRRTANRVPDGWNRRTVVLGTLLLFAVPAAVGSMAGAGRTGWPANVGAAVVNGLIGAAAVMAAATCTWVCALRWDAIGDARALRYAVAVPLVFLASPAFTAVLSAGAASHAPIALVPAVQVPMALVGTALAGQASLRPDVDVALGAARLVAGVVGAVVVLGAAVALLMAFVLPDGRVPRGVEVGGRLALVGLWCAIGGRELVAGWVLLRPLRTWVGLAIFGLGIAHVSLLVSEEPNSIWRTGASLGAFSSVLLALVGVGTELKLAYLSEQGRVYDLEVLAARQQERLDRERNRLEEHLHDQASAVLAIEGVVEKLGRTAAEEDRKLSAAASLELQRLRRAVEQSRPSRGTEISMRELLEPLVLVARSNGVDIHLDVSGGVVGVGRADRLQEVVQNLIDNARLHAWGRTVWVRAGVVGTRIELRVVDDGPGVPAPIREVIFDRGVTSVADTHAGLGLYTARRLMREMGGNLAVEDTPTRGASFLATLPAAGADETDAPGTADPGWEGRAW